MNKSILFIGIAASLAMASCGSGLPSQGQSSLPSMDGGSTTPLGFFSLGSSGSGSLASGPAQLVYSNNKVYGVTANGGSSGYGTLFKMDTDGSNLTLLHEFNSTDGESASSLLVNNNIIYGTAMAGGANASGVVFKVNVDGTGFALLHEFTNVSEGSSPSSLALSGGVFYGTLANGGSGNNGTIYKMNIDGTGFTVLYSFAGGASDGAVPYGGVTVSGNVIYGTTNSGGANASRGTIYKVNTDGTGFTLLHSFGAGSDGFRSYATLVLLNGVLYGATPWGGSGSSGTVYKVNVDGTGYSLLHEFAGTDGYRSFSSLTTINNQLYGTTLGGGTGGVGVLYGLGIDGTGFSVLHTFNTTDGSQPTAAPLSPFDTSGFFGASTLGGDNGTGTIFSYLF